MVVALTLPFQFAVAQQDNISSSSEAIIDRAEARGQNEQQVLEGKRLISLPVHKLVKEKLYPGGRDEEELSVQSPLYVPWRSLNLHLIHKQTLEQILNSEQQSSSENSSEELKQ